MKKTCIQNTFTLSMFEHCQNNFNIRKTYDSVKVEEEVFVKNKEDDKQGVSVDDIDFLEFMSKKFVKGPRGNWSAPLPFKHPKPKLPNNRSIS